MKRPPVNANEFLTGGVGGRGGGRKWNKKIRITVLYL